MSNPRVVSVTAESPASRAGLVAGDEIISLNARAPRDVIQYQLLTDEPELTLEVNRGGLRIHLEVAKREGEPLGAEIHSPLFDQLRTCDNHCEFCFVHQLPPGLRASLYEKDDDYRLSFLYGNFTTLTRFTEADLERVVCEGLSPLYVSIHATDPTKRAELLRNRRGATSLRWLRALLDHEIAVHGQIVVCPDLNDGPVLEDTLAGVLDRYPELETLCVVPLGVSRFNTEPRLRRHTREEARSVVETVHDWQRIYLRTLGRRLVHAADEYYILAEVPFPESETYEGFPMHEDGVGMARTFEAEFDGDVERPTGVRSGFFAWVDGAPADRYRAPRRDAATPPTTRIGTGPVAILTGVYGARVIAPLVANLGRSDVEVVAVPNEYFGGNVAVSGLMVGEDLARVLAERPSGERYLLPDVCLSQGRFLDGSTPAELPRDVEVVATDGLALRAALEVDGR